MWGLHLACVRVATERQHVESLSSRQILQSLCEFSNYNIYQISIGCAGMCFERAIMHTEVMPQLS